MAVHLDACIQCKRCVRACREEQVNDVIGYAFRGGHSKIVFDLDDPMGDSTCVACGECVQACPTGALMPARDVAKVVPDKQVDSVCPYCGVGCQLTYNVKDNNILYVQGKDGPANSSRLCVKGRYGFDYVQHRHRLTTPLIRKKGVPKHKDFVVDPENWRDGLPRSHVGRKRSTSRPRAARHPRHLRQAGARRFRLREGHERRGVSISEAGAHRVRIQQRRPLHAPLPRLERGRADGRHQLGRGVESGARCRQCRSHLRHRRQSDGEPSGRGDLHQERRQGREDKLIVADPRRSDLARHATYYLQFNPDTDVALLNAMLHVIVEEGLVDEAFVRDRTSGYDALAENVKKFSPEKMAPICGIDAQTIREVARSTPRRRPRSSSGAWASRSTCTAPTTRAA